MLGEATINQHDKYVLDHGRGDPLPPQEIRSTLSNVANKALESHLCIIIHREAHVKQRASTFDFYYYAKSLSEYEFSKKIALMFPEEMHHDNLDFFMVESKKRGVIFRCFPPGRNHPKGL